MEQVSKEYFEKIFPELEKIYNHSHHTVKLWANTVRKKKIIRDVEYRIRQYWETGSIF